MYKATVNDSSPFQIETNHSETILNGQPFEWDLQTIGHHRFHILHENKSYTAELLAHDRETKTFTLRINQQTYQVAVQDKFDLLLAQMGMSDAATTKALDLKAPMPGMVLKILVKENDTVKKGDSLLILEAMKMENVLKAAGDGTIKSVVAKEKTTVEKGQVLIQIG